MNIPSLRSIWIEKQKLTKLIKNLKINNLKKHFIDFFFFIFHFISFLKEIASGVKTSSISLFTFFKIISVGCLFSPPEKRPTNLILVAVEIQFFLKIKNKK